MLSEAQINFDEPSALDVSAGTSGQTGGIEVSLVDLAILFARRKRFILGCSLGLSVLACTVAFLMPVSYTASTALLPPQQSSSPSSALLSQLGGAASIASMGGGGLSLKNPVDMYVSLMKSEVVEDAMVKRYHLLDEYHAKYLSDGRKALEDHVAIEGGLKDGIIRLSVTDHNAARSAELANGYVDQYRKLSASLATTEAAQRRMFFAQQLEQAKNSLADAEESLKLTEQTTGVVQMDSQARSLIESAASLRAQVAEQDVQVQSMRTYAAEGNIDLMQATQELAGLRSQLAKLAGAGDAEGTGLMVSKGQLPQASLEYARKLRDVKYNETIFDILARQFEVAKLDEAKEGSLIQVIDVASVPDRKSKPHRLLYLVGGFLFGFFVSLSIVFVQGVLEIARTIPEYRNRLSDFRKALRVF